MKKVIFAAVLGLLLQTIPTSVFAYSSYDIGGKSIFIFPGVMAIVAPDSKSELSIPEGEKVAQGEFEQLNSIPENVALLTQTAGGSLNTLDILK